jgi:hypothetical protein
MSDSCWHDSIVVGLQGTFSMSYDYVAEHHVHADTYS